MDHAEQRNPDDNEGDTGMNTGTDPCERSIWYRDDSSSEKCGPVSLTVVQNWYNMSKILPSAEFSTDDGANWISIVELRRRNGPLLSLGNIGDRGNPFVGIAELRERVEAERADVERLEKEMEALLGELHANEEQLKKLKELEQILDISETVEQLDDGPDVAAAPAPVDAAVPVSQPQSEFDPQVLVEKPFETVAGRLKQQFEKCDWTILNQRTEHRFNSEVRCITCKIGPLLNGSSLIGHFTGQKHMNNRPSATAYDARGAYTKEALAYWIDQLHQCPRYRGFSARAKNNKGARLNVRTFENLPMTTDMPEPAATPPAVAELTTKSLLTALLKVGLVFLPFSSSPILAVLFYLICLPVGVYKQWLDKSWLRRSRDKHFGVLDVASDALKLYLEPYEARLNILSTFIVVIFAAKVAYVLHPRFIDTWSLSYGEIGENLVQIIRDFLAFLCSRLIDTGYSLVHQPILGHVHNAALAYFCYTVWVDERMQKANKLEYVTSYSDKKQKLQ